MRRKWFVRGLVFTILGGIACACWLYQHWTNPTAVRQQVMAKLQSLFPGAVVSLDAARLRLLGGISLTELRLSRRDDPNGELAHVPSAVLYHDKEQLLEGTLSIRKIELHRPRLRLVRQHDGAWNIDGLTASDQKEQTPIPTIVIHQGTLILEDRQGGTQLPNIEISNVSLTLLNDPLSTIVVEGTAASETLGTLHINGTWNRTTREARLAAQAKGVALNSALVRLVGQVFQPDSQAGKPDLLGGQVHLEGQADVRAELTFQPRAPQPLSYEVQCQIRQGKFQHPLLSVPLHDLAAQVRLTNGLVRLDRLEARSGNTLVQARGSAWLPGVERDFEAVVDVKHLHLDDPLKHRLPEKIQVLCDSFQPTGPVGLRIECARKDGQWAPLAGGGSSRIVLLPENLRVTFTRFPYPVERMTGSVEYNLLSGLVKVDTTAYTGTQPIAIQGTWQGQGLAVDCRFDIQANDVPLDDKLLAALPGSMQKMARSFHPAGKIDVKAHIRHVPGTKEYYQEYHARLHDLSVVWDEFPYPVENMTGYLDIYPNHWECRDVRGSHNGGEIFLHGQATPASDDSGHKGMIVHLTAKNVAADRDLRQALRPLPGLAKTWDAFVPSGRFSLKATIERPPGPPAADGSQLSGLKFHLTGGGCAVTPVFFPYTLEDVHGELHYHRNHVEAINFTAHHQGTQIKLDKSTVDLYPGGGYYAKLNDLRAYYLKVDEDLLAALPSGLKKGCESLNLKNPIGLAAQVVITQAAEPGSPPALWWDGGVRLENAALTTGLEWSDVTGTLACRGLYQNRQLKGVTGNFKLDRGTLLRQPFQEVHGHFQVKESTPDVLNLHLNAPLFGGDISGPVRFEFGSTPRYELNLTASQISLQEFGRHNLGPQSNLQGVLVGRLHLQGQGSNPETLDGNGSLEVPAGRLYNLPLLLDLLKFLGLRWPDRTAFDEAKAVFNIHGRRVRMDHLELVGNAVSLYGKGDFQLDGSDLKLDLYPTWGRVQQFIPPALRGIPAEIGKNMLKIEMRGKVSSNSDDLKFTKKPMPILLDPLYQMRERLLGEGEWRRDTRPASMEARPFWEKR